MRLCSSAQGRLSGHPDRPRLVMAAHSEASPVDPAGLARRVDQPRRGRLGGALPRVVRSQACTRRHSVPLHARRLAGEAAERLLPSRDAKRARHSPLAPPRHGEQGRPEPDLARGHREDACEPPSRAGTRSLPCGQGAPGAAPVRRRHSAGGSRGRRGRGGEDLPEVQQARHQLQDGPERNPHAAEVPHGERRSPGRGTALLLDLHRRRRGGLQPVRDQAVPPRDCGAAHHGPSGDSSPAAYGRQVAAPAGLALGRQDQGRPCRSGLQLVRHCARRVLRRPAPRRPPPVPAPAGTDAPADHGRHRPGVGARRGRRVRRGLAHNRRGHEQAEDGGGGLPAMPHADHLQGDGRLRRRRPA